ncbi:uncharacterized protein PRCAT00005472001 [Priceomyces carsonii]|uniref:uncharacterized protein n=1 Tax=Priceomyces carsonii TaxID=28549 RepID=UPI002ED785CB|nr:unnamed protein product [Priceomyces carsonii]
MNYDSEEKKNNIIQSQTLSSDEIAISNPKKFVYDGEARQRRLDGGVKLRDVFIILCAGFALISDGYQNNVMTMLNSVFTQKYPKEYTADMKTSVSYASTVGTIFGQVVIGFAADYMGRKWSIIVATLFLILGTCMCAASHGKTIDGMLWMLIISRGVTGFGIGAEYPSSSVSASEAANESVKKRGLVFVLCTNFPLSMGGPIALCVFLIVYQITSNLDAVWRTMFAIGAFFPLSVFYFRLKMVTSLLYKESAIVKQRAPYLLTIRFYWKRMIGTCVSWFLYDFVTFPNGVFSAGIISKVINDTSDLQKVAEWNLLLLSIAIPGVFVGGFLMDRIGRKYTLMLGFGGYIVFGLIVGCAYDKLKAIVPLFIIFYGLMQSSGNMGPGNCMGLVSAESFASPVRGTLYGLSAAIGKVGAVVGTKTFTPIQTNLGDRWTFIIAAICGLAGITVAYFFVPHLKEGDLLEQDILYKNYLVEHGWKGHFGLEKTTDDDLESDTVDDFESKK